MFKSLPDSPKLKASNCCGRQWNVMAGIQQDDHSIVAQTVPRESCQQFSKAAECSRVGSPPGLNLSCRAGLGRFRPGGVFAKSRRPWLHLALHFLHGEVLAVGAAFVGCGGCGPVSLVVHRFVLPDQPVANGIQWTCMDCWTFALEPLRCLLLKGQDFDFA